MKELWIKGRFKAVKQFLKNIAKQIKWKFYLHTLHSEKERYVIIPAAFTGEINYYILKGYKMIGSNTEVVLLQNPKYN